MQTRRIGMVLGLVLGFALFAGRAFAAGPDDAKNNFVADRILVKFKAGTTAATRESIHRAHGGARIADIPTLGYHVVRIPAGHVADVIAAYRKDKNVEIAEPDYIAHAVLTPNDPSFALQWGLTKIQCPQAWDVTTGAATVKVAILDTGICQNHPDLAARIVANQNFAGTASVDDLFGHGTHVAGIAAAITNNGAGVAGVGFNCSLMNVKVLDDTGNGSYSAIASGITWAADNGAKVINMSLGGSAASSTLQSAVNYAWNKGVVLVAAAGNGGNSRALYPAYYSNCISVAATDQNDSIASWSTYGRWVTVAAPGVNIYSTEPTRAYALGGSLNYGYLSGTSMSTPHVAGLAALIWSTSYGTTNVNVRSRIQSTADPIAGTGTKWIYGRINAAKAVQQPTPGLSVSVSAPVLTNQLSFTVQATVSNPGGATTNGVAATLTLPPGLSASGNLTQTLGNLAANGFATASWAVTASADGAYPLAVNATSSNAPGAGGTATVTEDTTPPPQVTGLTVTSAGSSQLNLSWTPSAASDLKNYRVYRSLVSGGPYAAVASPAANSDSDTGLASSTTYYYVVSAADTAGNEGARSAEVFGTTSANNRKIHVKNIALSLSSYGFTTYVSSTVTLEDPSGNAVPGATVAVRSSGVVNGTAAGATDSTGSVTFLVAASRTAWLRARSSTITVTNVTLNGWTYDPSSNVMTSNSIQGP